MARRVEVPVRVIAGIERHVLRIDHIEEIDEIAGCRAPQSVASISSNAPEYTRLAFSLTRERLRARFIILSSRHIRPGDQATPPSTRTTFRFGYFTNTPSHTMLTRCAINIWERQCATQCSGSGNRSRWERSVPPPSAPGWIASGARYAPPLRRSGDRSAPQRRTRRTGDHHLHDIRVPADAVDLACRQRGSWVATAIAPLNALCLPSHSAIR